MFSHMPEIMLPFFSSRSRTGHAGFSRQPGRNDDGVGARYVFVVVRSSGLTGIAANRPGFGKVQGFALRHAFHNVREHHIAQFHFHAVLGSGCAHIARADAGYFKTFSSGHIARLLLFKLPRQLGFTHCTLKFSRRSAYSDAALESRGLPRPVRQRRDGARSDTSRRV